MNTLGKWKFYLGYYTKKMKEETDNSPVGLILFKKKDDR